MDNQEHPNHDRAKQLTQKSRVARYERAGCFFKCKETKEWQNVLGKEGQKYEKWDDYIKGEFGKDPTGVYKDMKTWGKFSKLPWDRSKILGMRNMFFLLPAVTEGNVNTWLTKCQELSAPEIKNLVVTELGLEKWVCDSENPSPRGRKAVSQTTATVSIVVDANDNPDIEMTLALTMKKWSLKTRGQALTEICKAAFDALK